MFGWLASLFASFRAPDRCLFRYWDGVKQRAIDPVATYRLIWTSDLCDLLPDCARARNPLKADGAPFYPISEVYEAEDRLRAMTRKVFGVKEWTESTPGLTVDETDELLNSFLVFCADLKKKRSPSPTASAPTESKELESSSDTVGSPDGADPDYCCSPTASTAAAPTGP